MSEEQRNEPPREEKGDAGATGEAGEAGKSGETGKTGKTGATGEAARIRDTRTQAETVGAGSGDAGATGVTGTTREAGHDIIGEGAPRYGDVAEEVPPAGSEQSWSAAPHPGYVADPKAGYSGRRVAAGTLIGLLVLAFGVFAGVRLLASRSSNGNGPAPWTAAVQQHGAVVGGINAQNADSAPQVVLPAAVPYGGNPGNLDAINKATAACQGVIGNPGQLTTKTGATGTLGNWSAHATPTVQSLRAASAKFGVALATKDAAQIAASTNDMCAVLAQVDSVPGVPDAAAAQAWSSAATFYAEAAANAIKGVSGDPEALQTAAADVRNADAQLDALSARVAAATT
ncbi:hypothetical protein [Catenulispora subtropica]